MPPNANPLSAEHLAAFVATLEAGSVHGGADALDLTPRLERVTSP